MKKANFQWAFSGGLRNALLTLGLVVFFCLGAATTASAQWVSSNEALDRIEKQMGETKAAFTVKVNDNAESSAVTTALMNYQFSLYYMERVHNVIKDGSDVPAALQTVYTEFVGVLDGRSLSPLDNAYNMTTQLLQQ